MKKYHLAVRGVGVFVFPNAKSRKAAAQDLENEGYEVAFSVE